VARYNEYVGFGVAGNFALHLEQAGESGDFKEVITDDPNGPKGMFPFYIPNRTDFLGIYPLSSDTIILPLQECNVQIEPEVALICDLEYDTLGNITHILPQFFGAYNDCSLRIDAPKISLKKNWGPCSKGLSPTLIPIDSFTAGGIMDTYRIASFLKRDEIVMRYGEDVELTGYSYFHEKLSDWMRHQINIQTNVGPLEPIHTYLKEAGCPTKAIISIGATRYTHFGERHFLHEKDEISVVLYDSCRYAPDTILSMVSRKSCEGEGISALVQRVERG